jgi:hypothetical protein
MTGEDTNSEKEEESQNPMGKDIEQNGRKTLDVGRTSVVSRAGTKCSRKRARPGKTEREHTTRERNALRKVVSPVDYRVTRRILTQPRKVHTPGCSTCDKRSTECVGVEGVACDYCRYRKKTWCDFGKHQGELNDEALTWLKIVPHYFQI